jgi:LysR family transcriptional activator of mexEF-oprN operon
MNVVDVERIDLNLLRVFMVLMQEESVTRAAARLSLGQPAVSHALGRLREALGDPLFVREGRRLQATDTARHLMADLSSGFEAIESALRANRSFDPSTAEKSFSVGLPDDLQIAMLASLGQKLATNAPATRLMVRHVSHVTASSLLEAGDVSTVIGFFKTLPSNAKTKKLRDCRYGVLRGDGARKRLDLDAYCRRNHVLVTAKGDFRGVIDAVLQKMDRVRRVTLSVPLFASLPALIEGSDLIATVPDHVGRALASQGRLRFQELPFESPTFAIRMAWRAAVDRDPAEIWFRHVLTEHL